MKTGMVVQIRVNPADCQGVLDLMGLLNIDPYDGRSFASCVSLALSSMLGSFRQANVLQEIDPFQFLNRMGPFLESRNNKTKHAMAQSLYRNGGHQVATVALPTQEVRHPGQYVPEALTGWTEEGPVTTANVPMKFDQGDWDMMMEVIKGSDTEVLVEEYHKLKSKAVRYHTKVDAERYKQIQKELDSRRDATPDVTLSQ